MHRLMTDCGQMTALASSSRAALGKGPDGFVTEYLRFTRRAPASPLAFTDSAWDDATATGAKNDAQSSGPSTDQTSPLLETMTAQSRQGSIEGFGQASSERFRD